MLRTLLSVPAVVFLILSLSPSLFAGERGITREQYLACMTSSADSAWNTLEADRRGWRASIDLNYVFGFAPPGNEVYLGALCANLFEMTGERKYLERARDLLVHFGTFRDAYPKDYSRRFAEYREGLPALPNIFYFAKYVRAYEILLRHGACTPAQRATVEDNIAGSANYVARFQEWGPMNRAMLRAEALLYAARVLPNHPDRGRWLNVGEAIAQDNWEEWEIEDATGYHAIWLYSLLGYASDVREDEGFYRAPLMHYYFEYFLQLLSPAGTVPDFGDAYWDSEWARYIPFFEKGAAVYKDPRYRWAAERIWKKYLEPLPRTVPPSYALFMSDACRWADFSVAASRPESGSRLVLEDLVGKKAVFRDGWGPDDTYLLYNFRDEGDGGWLYREYLRTTIPVEEEKMHHGHADEQSIPLLMKRGSILLHDGGYRDFMPSGPYGQFRADYFHNRVSVRDGKIALGQHEGEYRYASPNRAAVPGQTFLDFFRNSGAYRQVRTQRIDFRTLPHFDQVRTRLIDAHLGYEADRIVTYVKDLDGFVVFDVVRYRKDGYLTMANVWYARQIHRQGEGWYQTSYDSLGKTAVQGPERLLIVFPDRSRLMEGVAPVLRYHQKELAIHQLIGRHGYPNDLQVFVTVLLPHDSTADPEALARSVSLVPVDVSPGAVAVRLTSGATSYLVGAKLDLEAELVRDWRRPMYTYDSGKTRYGDYETDAFALFAVERASSVWYAMTGGVKIRYRDRVLFEQEPSTFNLNFDGSPDQPGVGKLRTWTGEFQR